VAGPRVSRVSEHEVDFLAKSHGHHFRYRTGEMIGLDRERREVEVAALIDEEGEQVTPRRKFRFDTLAIAVGSQGNDFGTPGGGESLADARRSAAVAAGAWNDTI
jgi:NADH dehydrogenase